MGLEFATPRLRAMLQADRESQGLWGVAGWGIELGYLCYTSIRRREDLREKLPVHFRVEGLAWTPRVRRILAYWPFLGGYLAIIVPFLFVEFLW